MELHGLQGYNMKALDDGLRSLDGMTHWLELGGRGSR